MTDQPNNTITLNTSTEEIIRIDKKGFHYRGQFIADAGEAHSLMVDYLKQLTQPKPQEPTDEALFQLFNQNNWNYISPETFFDIAYSVLELL